MAGANFEEGAFEINCQNGKYNYIGPKINDGRCTSLNRLTYSWLACDVQLYSYSTAAQRSRSYGMREEMLISCRPVTAASCGGVRFATAVSTPK